MKYNDVIKLMKEFNELDIHKFEYEFEGAKIKLAKEDKQYVQAQEVTPVSLAPTVEQNEMKREIKTEASGEVVKTPLVGTYYSAPTPGDAPFVVVGKSVKKGETLCIIEAMKVLNEITAPCDGVVKEIFVQNEEVVGFDQKLMLIG